MNRLFFLLAVLLAFASCGSIPEIPEIDRSSLQEQEAIPPEPDESSQLAESPEPEESLEGPVTEDISMEEQEEQQFEDWEDFYVPLVEMAEADYPEETPEADSPPVPTEEPIAQQPPPQEVPPQQEAPPPAPPPVETPPPVVQQETPPSEEPPPEEPPPVRQERETPSYVIPDMPFQPPTIIPEPTEANLPYSRTVRAMVGQFIEIPFRGSGWVYLGEFGSRRGVSYDSRRMETEGMSFIFRADAEGTYSLRFNRHDFVRDVILNDYVKVIVEQRPPVTSSAWSSSQVGPDRVYALPRWPLATEPEGRVPQGQTAGSTPEDLFSADTAPEVAAAANVAPAGTPQTSAEITSIDAAGTTQMDRTSADAAAAPPQIEDWLKRAREEYDAGRIKNALDALDQFMILYPAGSDEAFWLYGQSLEANNEATRDIRLSLDYYRRLTREFPLSGRYDEARQRIAYLERFYFNIQ